MAEKDPSPGTAPWIAEYLDARSRERAGRAAPRTRLPRRPPDPPPSPAATALAAAHQKLVRPPQPRREALQMAVLIGELLGGGREPAVVEQALARWRDRRAAGEPVGRSALAYILEDIELAAARAARAPYRNPADPAAYLTARF